MPLGKPDEYVFVAHKLTGMEQGPQYEDTDRLACSRVKKINVNQVEPNARDAAAALSFCFQCNAVVSTPTDDRSRARKNNGSAPQQSILQKHILRINPFVMAYTNQSLES